MQFENADNFWEKHEFLIHLFESLWKVTIFFRYMNITKVGNVSVPASKSWEIAKKSRNLCKIQRLVKDFGSYFQGQLNWWGRIFKAFILRISYKRIIIASEVRNTHLLPSQQASKRIFMIHHEQRTVRLLHGALKNMVEQLFSVTLYRAVRSLYQVALLFRLRLYDTAELNTTYRTEVLVYPNSKLRREARWKSSRKKSNTLFFNTEGQSGFIKSKI